MALLKNNKKTTKNSSDFMNMCMTFMTKHKMIMGAAIVIALLVIIVMIFGTPSAETVFKDMNEEMLKTKLVTVDQKLTVNSKDGSGAIAEISSSLFMDLNSNKDLLSRGIFSLNVKGSSTPMSVSGDLIKTSDGTYVRFGSLSSTDATISEALAPIETKLKSKWIVSRDGDQFTSFAKSTVESMSSILPTPFANLDDTQREAVLDILRDKSTYTINESSKVDVSGVSAYKYSITYNKDQYKKIEKAISGYVSYFKSSDNTGSEITSLTVWVDINTKRIIKIEYVGTSTQGDATGVISFSKYGQDQVVEKPSSYSIESELLN